ncbi:hypothetical protein HN587_01120 [Candidatus Woesearchaeota archaeon]|jgi:hypothetical protein|nr:hypothetical protein [Candidatus Woesearchaeota archaeon]
MSNNKISRRGLLGFVGAAVLGFAAGNLTDLGDLVQNMCGQPKPSVRLVPKIDSSVQCYLEMGLMRHLTESEFVPREFGVPKRIISSREPQNQRRDPLVFLADPLIYFMTGDVSVQNVAKYFKMLKSLAPHRHSSGQSKLSSARVVFETCLKYSPNYGIDVVGTQSQKIPTKFEDRKKVQVKLSQAMDLLGNFNHYFQFSSKSIEPSVDIQLVEVTVDSHNLVPVTMKFYRGDYAANSGLDGESELSYVKIDLRKPEFAFVQAEVYRDIRQFYVEEQLGEKNEK